MNKLLLIVAVFYVCSCKKDTPSTYVANPSLNWFALFNGRDTSSMGVGAGSPGVTYATRKDGGWEVVSYLWDNVRFRVYSSNDTVFYLRIGSNLLDNSPATLTNDSALITKGAVRGQFNI